MRTMYLRWENPLAFNCATCECGLPEGALLIRVPTDGAYRTTGHMFRIKTIGSRNSVLELRATLPLCGADIVYGSIMTVSDVPGLIAKMSAADREVFLGELSMLILAGGP